MSDIIEAVGIGSSDSTDSSLDGGDDSFGWPDAVIGYQRFISSADETDSSSNGGDDSFDSNEAQKRIQAQMVAAKTATL